MYAAAPQSAYAVTTSLRPAEHSSSSNGPSHGCLPRWNVQANRLPDPAGIKAIHVYDFDNTLFLTPLPNRKIWSNETYGRLMEIGYLKNGGWWHDARILAATGKGADVEEATAWKGWWNEHVVSLVRLSMEQKDALTVLLTGRSAKKFGPLIQRIVAAKKLKFDIVGLKTEEDERGDEWKNTLAFKEAFLTELLDTYREADEFRIYEDRVRHVAAFETFARKYQEDHCRPGIRAPLKVEVIQVAEGATTLDPVTEIAEVYKMVDEHNANLEKPGRMLHVRRTVFYTGYLLNPASSTALLNALEIPKMLSKESDIKLMGNNVLITPRPAPHSLLQKAGGLGTKVEFEVVGLGQWDEKVWAAEVAPVNRNIKVVTDNARPMIVLAVRRTAKPAEANKITTWLPPKNPGLRFWTVIGERQLLRIDEEGIHEGAFREAPRRTGAPLHGTRTPPHPDRERDRRESHYHGGHSHGHYDRDRDRESHYRSVRGGTEHAHRGHRGGRGGRGGGTRGGGYRGRGASSSARGGLSRDAANPDSMAYMSDLY